MKYKYFLINSNVQIGNKESLSTEELLRRNVKFLSQTGTLSKKFEKAINYDKLSEVMENNSLFNYEEINQFFIKKKLIRQNKKTGEWSLPRESDVNACINKYVQIGKEI
jgi:ribosomal protein S20